MPQVDSPVGEVDRSQGAIDALADVGQLVEAGEALEVLGHGETQVEPRRLGHDRDSLADIDAILGVQWKTGDDRGTSRRGQQSAESTYRSRLARAVGAEEAEDLAVLDSEGDVRDGRTLTEAFGEAFDKYSRAYPSALGAVWPIRGYTLS